MILIPNLGRCLSHVSHCHMPLKKTNKNVTEQMTSNSVWLVTVFQRRISSLFGLWTLAPRARAVLFEYMQFLRVFENITFCSLFTNRLRPFRDFNHHSNQNQPPLPLLIGDGLLLSVLRACNDFCCISACLYLIVSRHCSVQFIRSFHLLGRTPKEFFFAIFGRTISVAEHSVP